MDHKFEVFIYYQWKQRASLRVLARVGRLVTTECRRTAPAKWPRRSTARARPRVLTAHEICASPERARTGHRQCAGSPGRHYVGPCRPRLPLPTRERKFSRGLRRRREARGELPAAGFGALPNGDRKGIPTANASENRTPKGEFTGCCGTGLERTCLLDGQAASRSDQRRREVGSWRTLGEMESIVLNAR